MNLLLTIIKIVESFLPNGSFAARIEDKYSSPHQITTGVPQDSSLPPTIYILYINNMPVINKAEVALFSNDIMFLAKNHNATRAKINLQKQINFASDWFSKWKININELKTVDIPFGSIRYPYRISPITLNGKIIHWSSKAKYLGVIVGRKLSFNTHVTNIIRKLPASA